ncbi:uncharacterized protein LOC105684164 [Athalia rosae]|uniref:uncharacterized protein LOC105684164 n=1 Tax=Athalia rosae TaxID=37344 RepID=UPI0020341D21|nr:uncharacterized protein LOC105684164 [Athalia rosae]
MVKFLITCVALLSSSVCLAQGEMYGGRWLDNLYANINRMTSNINENLRSLNDQIQDGVRRGQESIDNMNANIQEGVANLNRNIEQDLQTEEERINQITDEIRRNVIVVGQNGANSINVRSGRGYPGQSISIDSIPGGTRTIYSGTTGNGRLYYRESEDVVIGNTLYHTARVYNHTSQAMDEYRYTLDLADPSARPVYLPTNQGNTMTIPNGRSETPPATESAN